MEQIKKIKLSALFVAMFGLVLSGQNVFTADNPYGMNYSGGELLVNKVKVDQD